MGRLIRTIVVTATALGVLVSGAQAAIDFTAPVSYPAGAPTSLASGDFNADGILDLVAVGESSPNATVLRGVGDGTFGGATSFAVDQQATGIAAGPLNSGGASDVVTSENSVADEINRYLADPSAASGFGPKAEFGSGGDPLDVELGDIDGDNDLDVAIARDAGVTFYFGDGAGNLTLSGTNLSLGMGNAVDVELGKLDSDNDIDIAVAHGSDVYAAFNNGAGVFTPSPQGGLVGGPSLGLAIADVDRNGRGDIVAVRNATGDLAIVRSTAAGFAASPEPAGGDARAVDGADLDSDGIPDLVVANTDGEITALVGRGDGEFTPTNGYEAGGSPSDVVIGDFNRDGNPDAAVANPTAETSGRIQVFLSRRPQLSFTPPNIDFGDVRPGTASAVRTMRLTNNGPPRARIADVAAQGAAEFTIVSNNCDGASLGIGQSCEVGVRFTPTVEGRREGRLGVATLNAGGPYAVGLAGTGRNPVTLPGDCANDLNGTPAGETLNGTPLGDNIFGFGGNDVLNGLAGNDCLIGGPGNDRLNGGTGNDALEGSRGNDTASGGSGRDRIVGESGRDRLSGGSGRDALNGGSSPDRLSGGASHDRLSGGSGNDRLTGSTGNDRLTGGSGRNSYSAGSGRDRVNARNRRRERINCGSGRDTAVVDRADRVRGCERVRRR